MKTRTRVATAALCMLLAGSLGIGNAVADPVGAPTYRQLAGTGSDTTEEILQALSETTTIGGTKVLGSYNATGSAQITTKDPATTTGCTINRPNGSTAGRNALLASLNANGGAGDGCLDFARSSSARGSTNNTPDLAYVPFAVEGLSFAITSTSTIPRKLSKADLQGIYKCTITGGGTFKPLLPQTGSGTRSAWITYIYGAANADLTPFTCLVDNAGQEHDGRILDNNSIVPYSSAQYVAQTTGTIQDKRGRAVLGQIDATTPLASNAGFANVRSLFNLIPVSKIGTAPWSTTFAGSGSLICTQTSQLALFGLAPAANCGDTSDQG